MGDHSLSVPLEGWGCVGIFNTFYGLIGVNIHIDLFGGLLVFPCTLWYSFL